MDGFGLHGIGRMSPRSNWISEVRAAVQRTPTDFFHLSPARYWFDLALSVVLAYTAGFVFLTAPLGSWIQIAAYPFAVVLLYRAGALIHEVAHLPSSEMRTFKVAWNLVVGVILLTPSPFYTRHHRDHHSPRYYGHKDDPEYIAHVFERGNARSLLGYLCFILVYPLLVFIRFALVPLTYIHPRIREWTLARASSLTFNFQYERKLTPQDRWSIAAIEWLCCLRAWMIPLVVLLGAAHWSRMPLLYSLAIGALVLNQMRLMGDHHFESDGGKIDLSDHILDSCNYTSYDPMTCVLFPFSIRYHALHHIFPTLPYHNLAAAHKHLSRELPDDSPYHGLDQGNWWSVARTTIFVPAGHARAGKRAEHAAAGAAGT
jgi:fatty acid desaturase